MSKFISFPNAFVLSAFISLTTCAFVLPGKPGLMAEDSILVIFIEPVLGSNGKQIKTDSGLTLYSKLLQGERIKKLKDWMELESPLLAMQLLTIANETTSANNTHKQFHVAIEPGGNYGSVGFALKSDDKVFEYPKLGFIRLSEDKYRFQRIMAHETWHIIFNALNNHEQIYRNSFQPLFHSNGVISDRITAFDEGLAISLETIVAHFSKDPELKKYYQHEAPKESSDKLQEKEFYFRIFDILTLAQSYDRYIGVRENVYAFNTVCNKNNYWADSYDKSRDFGALRNGPQLMASEGFHATFFYYLAMHLLSDGLTDVKAAYIPIFQAVNQALKNMRDYKGEKTDVPMLVYFMNAFASDNPDLKTYAFNLLFDLSKGSLFSQRAYDMWSKLYTTALRFGDMKTDLMPVISEIEKDVRKNSIGQAMTNPNYILKIIDPVVRVKVPALKVKMPKRFGGKEVMFTFEANTVYPCILKTVLGLSREEVRKFKTARRKKLFRGFDDFVKRSGIESDKPWNLSPITNSN